MLRRLCAALLVLSFVVAAQAAPTQQQAQQSLLSAEEAAAPSAAWLESAYRFIAESEYRLSKREGLDVWSAPNREKALRTTWQDGTVSYGPRNPADTSWSYDYELLGIGRADEDGRIPAAAPVSATAVKDGRIEWTRGNVTEWYVNDPSGVEQGFTLLERPAGPADSALIVEGAVSGLTPRAAQDGQRVTLESTSGTEVLQVTKLFVVDANGAELPARMEAFGQTMRIVVEDADATYPIVIDPLTDPLVMTDWTGDSGERQAFFGAAIAGGGDVNADGFADVAIGATGWDGGVFNGGGVFVWYGDAAGLGGDSSLVPSVNPADWSATGTQVGGGLGNAVAFIPDPNGGGGDALAAGARAFDVGGKSNAGRVSVWYSDGTTLSAVRDWTADGDQSGGFLGASLAAADVNADGFGDLFIGAYAYTYSGSATQGGAVFLFKGGAAIPMGVAGLNADDLGVNGIVGTNDDWSAGGTVANAQFGFSLAVGHVNTDGGMVEYPDLAVGTPRWTNPAVLEGAVFVFHGNEPGMGIPDLSLTPDTQIDGNTASGLFGYSVALGDVDGDGFDDLVAGAPYQESSSAVRDEGFIYLFPSSGTSTGIGGLALDTADATWFARGGELRAYLGWSVAVVHANCDNPLEGDVLAGSPGNDDTTARRDAGRADIWTYATISTAVLPSVADGGDADWSFIGTQRGEQAGTVVANLGDIHADGLEDGAVGSPRYDTGGSTAFADAGRVRIFNGSAAGGPDTDGDLIPDCVDPCPLDNGVSPDACGFCPSDPGGCDDGVGCTDDTCNMGTGMCEYTPNDANCDDSVACTDDSCNAATGCEFTANDANCDDSVACTDDSCNAVTGCVFAANDTNCDDSVDCTDDTCNAVTGCVFTANDANCDDSVDCTDDTCNAVTGCVYTANDANCDDSVACTDDTCNAVTGCVFTANDTNCDDSVACTDDTCNAVTGCVFTANDTNCDDSVDCTDDTCNAVTGCVFTANDANCDDSVDCTDDTCNAVTGCVFTANDANCDDSVACTDDTCNAVTDCVFTANDTNCDDGVGCTDDTCNSVTGCVYTANDTNCDDSVACTDDSCHATLGCQNMPNNGNCNDGVDCTDDTCDLTGDCLFTPNNGNCNDGVTCTTDTCTGGGCSNVPDGGACDDSDLCTDDSCSLTMDCQYDPIDSDGDTVPDCSDCCPNDPAKSTDKGYCGCGVAETDSDGDTLPDCLDLCPNDATAFVPSVTCPCAGGENCNNGSDDDGDFDVDCADADCVGHPACP